MFEIVSTKLFNKRLANLKKYFSLNDDEYNEAIENIKYSIKQLQLHGTLPSEYLDHVLTDEPWIGFNEYHVLDDLLVVYFKIDRKQRIRLVTITNHLKLRNGKFE